MATCGGGSHGSCSLIRIEAFDLGTPNFDDSMAPRLDDGKRWYSDGRFSDVL